MRITKLLIHLTTEGGKNLEIKKSQEIICAGADGGRGYGGTDSLRGQRK